MDESTNPKRYIPAAIVSIILFFGVLWSYQSARTRNSAIVLPGGITYLGPSPTSVPTPRVIQDGRIAVPATDNWTERKGVIFPYSVFLPSSLNLGVFPDDKNDSLTVFYPGTDANSNIFFRIEPCDDSPCGKPFVESWWKRYTWNGTKTITPFTNKNGLTGYRAKYLDSNGSTPYDHVFFDIPGDTTRMIWLSGKLFTDDVFTKIIESVNWKQ